MSTISRCFCVVVFAFSVLMSDVGQAHSQTIDRTLRSNSRVHGKTPFNGMAAELEKHTRILQRALARYMTSGGITPYIDSVNFWLELRESRTTAAARGAEERVALHDAFAKLEGDLVQIMLEDQLALYQHELDLNDLQFTAVDKILRKDADAKLTLLENSSDGRVFIRQLSSITIDTEASIKKILFPEQQKIYDKRQSEPRMIWTA